MPQAYKDLEATYKKLERHYRDMLDLEFTIQEGKLYMLQTRVGKRTGIAAVRIAVDMVKEGLISRKEALQRIGPDQLSQYLYPIFDAKEDPLHPLGKGLPAGPGAAAGKIALTADRAVDMKAAGDRVVLVRQETSPDDIHGMNAALGIFDRPWRHDVARRGGRATDGQSVCGGVRCHRSDGQPDRADRYPDVS